ncbi:MAG: methylated-DNA--[protein]-cysteine S-methyltransferase [Gemmatimonadales bacterium]|nr:methylated-DNA--[protein]-cysteine S-methyltransferase [Gemmatimonadales bacterium]
MTHAASLPSRRTLLRAVAHRDPAWDGLFVFAVRTTGVACRPVCPSRRARDENVEFFATLDAARHAGFRACRRCRPESDRQPDWWAALVGALDQHGGKLSDDDLRNRGFDPVVVRRHARRLHGSTFQAWARARRVAGAQRRLASGQALDRVIVESGYESHSGFRDAFARVVGDAPGRARDGEAVITTTWESPVGPIVAGAVDQGICLLEFGDHERLEQQAPRLQRWFRGPVVPGTHPHLDSLLDELKRYFAGSLTEFRVPLAVRGSPFEVAVWTALRAIPHGVTCSYADIARTIGSPLAVRAVGSANGRNRIAIVIPCHRVVNTGGKLGGYGGGLWRKVRLLELEGALRGGQAR